MHWMTHAVLVLGLAAAFLTTASWVPQAIRTIRTRRADDLSWGHLLLFGMGVFLWFLYGLFRSDIAIGIANLITLVLVVGIMFVKKKGPSRGLPGSL